MASTLAFDVLDRIFSYLADVDAPLSDSQAPRASPAKQAPVKRTEGLPHDVFEGVELCDNASNMNKSRSNREADTISGVQDTLACAARVNKHWLVAARRSLYSELQLRSWDSIILLSETLQFWNPRLRGFIREIRSLQLEDVESSTVPIQRIFSSLPNLRTLDARNIVMQVDVRHLPSLEKLFFSHINFRLKYEPAKKCTCSNCSVRAVPKSGLAPKSTLEVLAAFPSASFVYGSHTRFHRDAEASCSYSKPLPVTPRLPVPTLALGQLSTTDISLPTLRHLCIDLPIFDLDHVAPLFTPIASSLRHLKLVRPKFASVEYHPYEDAGITAILQVVGQNLATFHCSSSNTIGSTAFRCLKNVKDLRYSAVTGRMQTDVVDALPQSVERLDFRWPESDEFLHLLLSRLQEPEYLPSLKLAPYLRRARLDYTPSMEETLRVRVAAARTHMESRGLVLDDPNFANSLLAAAIRRPVPDFIPPYLYDHDDYYPYGTPPSDEDEDTSDYGYF